MELREAAEREVERIKLIEKELKVVNKKGQRLYELFKSYAKDCEHFLKEGKYLEAFEAAVISWAYVDAGLNLGLFSIPEKLRRLFTV